MEKRMLYKDYKQKYRNCTTLNDYDSITKTITVIIPDTAKYKEISTLFIKRIDRWEIADNDSFFIIQKQRNHRIVYYGFYAAKHFSFLTGNTVLRITNNKEQFYDKEEAFCFIETKFKEFQSNKINQ